MVRHGNAVDAPDLFTTISQTLPMLAPYRGHESQ